VLDGVNEGVGVGEFEGVGVLVAEIGGNGPLFTKEIVFLNEGATV
jgi:hypothetical protein